MMIQHVVVSAVNLNQGGTLTVAKELLAALDRQQNIQVTALVHKVSLYPSYQNIKLIEYPEIKNSWLKRLIFEYYTSKKLSQDLNADVWLCAHDMTANVVARKRYVYCHNPSPFYTELTLSDLKNDFKFWLFVHLYRFLYKINIKKNSAIFVQQNWIANAFRQKYCVDNVEVARPESLNASESFQDRIGLLNNDIPASSAIVNLTGTLRVFYPSVPRVFKNFEVILEAASLLAKKGNININFAITLDGQENRYARKVYKKYGHLKNVDFLGYLTQGRMQDEYRKSDIVCFPSKLETWGLPITEAKSWNKPLILADLEYAHETVGCYDKVAFFSPDDAAELARILTSLLEGDRVLKAVEYSSSALNGWDELVKYILKD